VQTALRSSRKLNLQQWTQSQLTRWRACSH